MKHFALVLLAFAAACAPTPQKLEGRTHIQAPNETVAQYYQDAIDQVQHLVPYLITTSTEGSSVDNVWKMHLVPCGTSVSDNKIICRSATCVTDYDIQVTWCSDEISDWAMPNYSAHEFGHYLGLYWIADEGHPPDGVMRGKPNSSVFTETELEQIETIYKNDW